MDAVASGASAGYNDEISDPRCLGDLVARNQAHAAAKDERIPEIAIVEMDRPVDRGNAHPVAVISNAAHDAL